ncbi:MAG: 3-hydroxyacyl-CoA dehydrogenase NAD-binding domain-containing protein [Candidatus Bathyarchaeaceae archaeon]
MKIKDLGSVAVIGAGTMGSDIALLFAISGFDVMAIETSKKVRRALRTRNEETLKELVKEGKIKEEPEEVLRRIKTGKELKDIEKAGFVFEAVTEDLHIKRKLFKELEKIVSGNTVLVTNTSSYRVTEITEEMAKPERVGGMHFSNPPISMPLVEVVKGERTSEETLAFISGVVEKIGKTPVVIKRDKRGFIMNRILFATMTDGFWALERGEVTPEELDAAIYSIGIPIGIADGADLIGIDVVHIVGKNFREAYGERFKQPPIIEKMIQEEKLGKKTGVGFYDWRQGKPKINLELAGKRDTSITVALAADEAFRLIKDEVANPEMIDMVMELGIMMPTGLCKMADEIGLDFLFETMKNYYEKYKLELYIPSSLFKEYVSRGWVGITSGRGFYTYEGST